jgi:uncharacterized protein (DUF305 family)
MSKSARKQPSRQDIESAIQKIVKDQEAFYQAWVQQWKGTIANVYGSSPVSGARLEAQ